MSISPASRVLFSTRNVGAVTHFEMSPKHKCPSHDVLENEQKKNCMLERCDAQDISTNTLGTGDTPGMYIHANMSGCPPRHDVLDTSPDENCFKEKNGKVRTYDLHLQRCIQEPSGLFPL